MFPFTPLSVLALLCAALWCGAASGLALNDDSHPENEATQRPPIGFEPASADVSRRPSGSEQDLPQQRSPRQRRTLEPTQGEMNSMREKEIRQQILQSIRAHLAALKRRRGSGEEQADVNVMAELQQELGHTRRRRHVVGGADDACDLGLGDLTRAALARESEDASRTSNVTRLNHTRRVQVGVSEANTTVAAKKYPGPDNEDRPCQMHSLRIDFARIGWDFVIVPRWYNAHYCSGTCSYPSNEGEEGRLEEEPKPAGASNVTQHVPRPSPSTSRRSSRCCVPESMSAMSVMYRDEHDKFRISRIPGLVVNSCGCR